MQFDPHSFYDRCNHILADIESGQSLSAIATLSGLLDAIAGEQESMKACRRILSRHPLYRIALSPAMQPAVATLGFARAEAARHSLTTNMIQSLSEQGKMVCLHRHPLRPLCACGGKSDCDYEKNAEPDQTLFFASDRPAVQHYGASDLFLVRDRQRSTGFDQILAPALADGLNEAGLRSACGVLAGRLPRGGRICLSAFSPNHLGQGWQTICLNRRLQCHAEDGFARIAAEIGATLACFRDASGGLVWADFKLAGQSN